MRTRRRTSLLGCIAASIIALQVNAQPDWNTGGNTVSGSEYLGANASSTVPLLLKTVANQPIDFSTNNILRMRLNETLLGQTANGYLGLNLSGHLGLGTPVPGQILSFLHINNNANLFTSFRPWMRTGTAITEATDWMYLGTKNQGPDRIDAVINWGDNKEANPLFGPDALRFIFTRTPSAINVASSLDGLEIARMIPAADGNQGYLGLGDYFTAGTNPTERLDLLNGRARIQQLPTDPIASTLTKFLVVDDTPGPDFGVVKWRNVPPGTGGGCEWTLLGAAGSNSNVATAYNLNPGCPQGNRKVGIGTNIPAYKLDVRHNAADGVFNGLGVTLTANSTGWAYGTISSVVPQAGSSVNYPVGVMGKVSGVDLDGYGIIGQAFAGAVDGITRTATGVSGAAFAPPSGLVQKAYGARGESIGNAGGTITTAYGVYGNSYGGNIGTSIGVYGAAANGAFNWAGYFAGNVNSTGTGYYVNGVFVASDAQFKTNVQPLENPLAIIMQLQPHRYDFLTDQYPQMNFPTGVQVGLVAQELEAVIPALVSDTRVASVTDSMGVEVTTAVDYKAVNYAGLVPYLIGAVQQQQATIAAMQTQIDQCCAAQNPGMTPDGDGSLKSAPAREDVQEQRLLIQPNPFTDHTTLSYYVPQAGKVSLQVSTSDGKPLGTLREEQAEAGAYTYEWNTSKLATGTYFCTFMLDGAVVVKRVVKVAR